jgi:glycosyltransferase involved in cell wall biosynthesis
LPRLLRQCDHAIHSPKISNVTDTRRKPTSIQAEPVASCHRNSEKFDTKTDLKDIRPDRSHVIVWRTALLDAAYGDFAKKRPQRHVASRFGSSDFLAGPSMKVLALTRYGRVGVSSRMRVYQYLSILQSSGIDVQVSPLLRDNYLRRFHAGQAVKWPEILGDYLKQVLRVTSARNFDLLWIEDEIFPNLPAWFEQALSKLGIRYAVDYDHAVFHRYDLSAHPAKRILRNKIDRVMRNSALVVCGNEYLAQRARASGAPRVEVVPIAVDLERYTVFRPASPGRVVVGWTGALAGATHRTPALHALKRLAGEFPLRMRVIGAHFSEPGLEVDCRPCAEKNEIDEIRRFDIGIMPLVDSPFMRGKSGYKVIQYMAAGKPVVASPVGANREIIVHGVNGYLADTPDDWLQAFRTLFESVEARQRMGAQGRLAVEERYCVDITGPRIAQLFHELAAT